MNMRSRSCNILLIMCDQLRRDFLGYAGARFAKTPNIDKLARSGVVFTHAYTNAPICTPARIALASGLLPHRLGALDNNAYLTASTRTYYQQLRDHGYNVGCVGKLDLAKPDLNCGDGALPRTYAWGFTHPVECMGRMDSLQVREFDPAMPLLPGDDIAAEVFPRYARGLPVPKDPYTRWLQQQGLLELYLRDMLACKGADWLDRHTHDSFLPTEAYEDMYIGRRSEQWIQEIAKDKPWHLMVSFVGPHDPFTPPKEFAELSRDVTVPEPIRDERDGKPAWIRRRGEQTRHIGPESITRTRRQYLACIQAIDVAIGRMMATLERCGMAENTIILFASDHGEMLYDHGLMAKHCAYEASMGIPCFATGPGIGSGQASDALVELIDVGATICDLAGCPRTDSMDARSFRPILEGQSEQVRDVAVCIEDAYRGITDGRYKLIVNMNDSDELYDLMSDPDELHNVLRENPVMARRLRLRLKERMMEGGWER